MKDQVPYQLSVSQLHDALEHILKIAQGSRTQTKRLRRIALRAEKALNGEEFSQEEAASLPTKLARDPISYEKEIRFLRREREDLLSRLDSRCG